MRACLTRRSASSFLGQDVFFDVEEDDYTSALSIETYVHKRVRPLLLHFSRKAGRLHWRMSILEYSMILLDSSIVVLGVLEGSRRGSEPSILCRVRGSAWLGTDFLS